MITALDVQASPYFLDEDDYRWYKVSFDMEYLEMELEGEYGQSFKLADMRFKNVQTGKNLMKIQDFYQVISHLCSEIEQVEEETKQC